MKVLTVIGARPQFIKASIVSKEFIKHKELDEIIIHTGQHFDSNMSDVFFDELNIPKPKYNLNINSASHGQMTGRMLEAIEKIIMTEKPDYLLVYGDTDSTLAGALAAAKLHVPIAHVEAGLRSYNRQMPEEINRILTDQLSTVLFCPTSIAVENLQNEGFENMDTTILQVGDVMQDSSMFFSEFALLPKEVEKLQLNKFILATIHRAENTDDEARLIAIVEALNNVHRHIAPVIMPLHPRTKQALVKFNLKLDVHIIESVGYFEMLALIKGCNLVMTDSGGLQKEAYFFAKACLTLRDQTEWQELLEEGANKLVGSNFDFIISSANDFFDKKVSYDTSLYGDGKAVSNIVNYFLSMDLS